jgi:putative membrane protein
LRPLAAIVQHGPYMKFHSFTTTLFLSGLLAFTAAAQKNQANRVESSGDRDFATKAAQGGMAEVELGKLATQRAGNDKVKQFGQRMVDDHSKANNELKTVAGNKGVALPKKIDEEAAATKKRLSALKGADFDRAYMEDMVKDHQKDVAEFQMEANSGSDPDIKAFASKTLPTLQEHLKMAQDTLASLGSGSTAPSSTKK